MAYLRFSLKLTSSGEKAEAPVCPSQFNKQLVQYKQSSFEFMTGSYLCCTCLTWLLLLLWTDVPALSSQHMQRVFGCFSAVWYHPHRDFGSSPSGLFTITKTDGEADKQHGLRSCPLLSTKYFSLATVSWPACRYSVQWSTHMHTDHRAVRLLLLHLPPSQASWLSPSTRPQSRKNSRRRLCSRSGCRGWDATGTAGEDVSAAEGPTHRGDEDTYLTVSLLFALM